MRTPPPAPTPAARPLLPALTPVVATVFVAFLVTGLAMPVLPLHVHHRLGLGTVVVGLVSGAQFAAALIARLWSGRFADARGGKRAVVVGLVLGGASGLVYLLSLAFVTTAAVSASILIAGRALLGAGEGFIVSGALSWGLAIAGPARAGKVMVWVGMAMYVAFAIAAPIGTALFASLGFSAIAVATTVIPLVMLGIVAPLRGFVPERPARAPFKRVFDAVWLPGLGLAFSSIGFGALTTFVVLLFAQHGWGNAWIAFTLMSGAFVLARLLFGHLPDRIGGARVALVSALVEAAGQALIWRAPSSGLAFLGAALTGLGYSLVYPSFGVVAVRRAPPESRAFVMGTFTAFLDVALGISGPALGLVARREGLAAVFLVSSLVVLAAVVVATLLVRARARTA